MNDSLLPMIARADAIMAELAAQPELLQMVTDIVDPRGIVQERHAEDPAAGMLHLYVRQYALGVAEDEIAANQITATHDLPTAFRRVVQKEHAELYAEPDTTTPRYQPGDDGDALPGEHEVDRLTEQRAGRILAMLENNASIRQQVIAIVDSDHQCEGDAPRLQTILEQCAIGIAEREIKTELYHSTEQLPQAFARYKQMVLFENDSPTPGATRH